LLQGDRARNSPRARPGSMHSTGEGTGEPEGVPRMKFNVLEHRLVPEHRLLSAEESQEVLARLHITRDQLPKIKKNDPVIQVLEKVHGPIAEGRIIKITRLSETAGVFEAYRLIVGR